MRSYAYQTEHGQLRRVLRGFLVAEVESSREAGRAGRVGCGAGAALESLLAAHPVDRHGRCRRCWGWGWLRRRGVCMVLLKARYWLCQPTHHVQAHLASELGIDLATRPGAADPDVTDVLPKVTDDPAIDLLQALAASPSPTAAAGRPVPDHGGAGEHPHPSDAPGLAVAHPGTCRRVLAGLRLSWEA